jgi:hypothetical protein
MKRRDFLEAALGLQFYGFVTAARAWARPVDSIISRWIEEIGSLAASVQGGTLSPLEWQSAIERLHAKMPIEDVIRFVDLDAALRRVKHPPQKLGGIEDVRWPQAGLHFGHKLFIYRKGSCTPPHAHDHLVSAHLVLKGEIRVRTFDRVQDLEGAILIKPARDRVEKPGATVSMSDYRDNVHWFEGLSDVAVSFDVPVPDIEPAKPYKIPAEGQNQIFLDASLAPRSDGLIEAPVIKFADAVKRFA